MTRFLVSLLAGVLVIAGAWVGWTRPGSVDELIARTADRAVEPSGAPIGMGPEPRGSRTARPGAPVTPPPAAGSPLRPARGAAIDPRGTDPGRACSVPAPTDARGMDALFAQLDGEPRLQAGDHGGSVRLADGRTVFVFGDTIRDTDVVSPFMVRNSVLVANGGCLRAMRAGDDGAVIPDEGDTGYWPMSLRARAVRGGTRVEVITAAVRDLGDRDFETVGSGLAPFDVPTNRMPKLVSHEPLTPTTAAPTVPTWGAAMWESGSWTYVFGTASNADKTTDGWALHVARVPSSHLADPSRWQYWDGSGWVSGRPDDQPAQAGRLIGPDDGVSHVLGVVEDDGSWYAISKEGDFTGDSLTVWKSPTVTGPWTAHPVRDLESTSRTLRYTPLPHPDLRMGSGKLLVSWSESPTTSGPYHRDPSLYRPRFTEVDLP